MLTLSPSSPPNSGQSDLGSSMTLTLQQPALVSQSPFQTRFGLQVQDLLNPWGPSEHSRPVPAMETDPRPPPNRYSSGRRQTVIHYGPVGSGSRPFSSAEPTVPINAPSVGPFPAGPESFPWSSSKWPSSSQRGVPEAIRPVPERIHTQRKPSNRDEFDGPHQLLDRPSEEVLAARERELPHLPTHLQVEEQDEILTKVNDRLSQCAFDFVAKYQFPIPLEQDKRPVRAPQDREWTEWVHLLKRLATKRRVPARVLYNGQIKQLVTVLENSNEMRHAAKHQSRPLKDDRNVLQLISAGLQVAKILKDASAMEYLDQLYIHTENLINSRRTGSGYM